MFVCVCFFQEPVISYSFWYLTTIWWVPVFSLISCGEGLKSAPPLNFAEQCQSQQDTLHFNFILVAFTKLSWFHQGSRWGETETSSPGSIVKAWCWRHSPFLSLSPREKFQILHLLAVSQSCASHSRLPAPFPLFLTVLWHQNYASFTSTPSEARQKPTSQTMHIKAKMFEACSIFFSPQWRSCRPRWSLHA